MKILFCTSEVTPFAKTGGMADVCSALPVALEKIGMEVTIIMPAYRSVGNAGCVIEKVSEQVSRSVIGKNIPVFFIRQDAYFNRDELYGDVHGDFGDNLERFHFFSAQALETIRGMDLRPDIIHCHDWQTSLIPAYLRYRYKNDPVFNRIKTVLTIHNLAYQGLFPAQKFASLGFDQKLFNDRIFEFYGKINLLKAGITSSDRITTVSPQYAREIQAPGFGCGLHGVLQARRDDLIGILNGIDQDFWDPAADPMIKARYSARTVGPKKVNKVHLQKLGHLPVRPDVPLFGFVGRLTHQKGIDLLIQSLYRLEHQDIQIVMLGHGEKRYVDLLRNIAGRFPAKIAVFLEFNEALAHQIYAGSDILLMPSNYEPCGLNQMIGLRYGTIPLVFKTGGLADTVKSYKEDGNGFVFTNYSREALGMAIQEAAHVYHDDQVFPLLRQKAFEQDFSWLGSAQAYADVYRQCLTV